MMMMISWLIWLFAFWANGWPLFERHKEMLTKRGSSGQGNERYLRSHVMSMLLASSCEQLKGILPNGFPEFQAR